MGGVCIKCGVALTPVNSAKSGKAGVRTVCKDCWASYMRGYNARPEQREKVKARNRHYKQKNEGRTYKDNRLRCDFNISLETYEALYDAQRGVCAICGMPERSIHKNGKVKMLAVDHCHVTGEVRGLLCCSCNMGLGKFSDSVVLLARAIEYLGATAPCS